MILNHVIEFLGLTVNSTSMELSLPLLKIKHIQAEARKLMREKIISARNLTQLLGKMNATVCLPLFSIGYLQMALSNTLERNNQNYEALTTLPTEYLNKLNWWNTHMLKWEIDLTSISDRMGSPLFLPVNRRSMVKSESNNAHQLSKTASS